MAGKRGRKILVGGWVLIAVLAAFTGLVRGWGGTEKSSLPAAGFEWKGDEHLLSDPPITFDDCTRCHPGDENLARHHELIATAGRSCRECHGIEVAEPGTYRVRVERECRGCHHLAVHAQVRHRIGGCGPCHPEGSGNIIRLHRAGTDADGTVLDSCVSCHGSPVPLVRETVARGQAGWGVTCRDCHGNGPAPGKARGGER